jgi:hypothetical protein
MALTSFAFAFTDRVVLSSQWMTPAQCSGGANPQRSLALAWISPISQQIGW